MLIASKEIGSLQIACVVKQNGPIHTEEESSVDPHTDLK